MGQNYLSIVIAQGMIADLRDRLYRHVQSLGLDFFTWSRAGEIHTRFLNDAGGLQNVLTQSFLGTFANLITLVGTLAIMIVINWKLALITAVALPTFALPILHFGQRRYKAMERETQRFDTVNTSVRTEQVSQLLVGQWLSVVVQSLAAIGPALLYTYGAFLIITHQIALGTIVAFATYLTQLYAPASSLAGANATLLGGLALFDRVFQYLEIPVSVPEPATPLPHRSVNSPPWLVPVERVNPPSFRWLRASRILRAGAFGSTELHYRTLRSTTCGIAWRLSPRNCSSSMQVCMTTSVMEFLTLPGLR